MDKKKIIELYREINFHRKGEFSIEEEPGYFIPNVEGYYKEGTRYYFREDIDTSLNDGFPIYILIDEYKSKEKIDDITKLKICKTHNDKEYLRLLKAYERWSVADSQYKYENPITSKRVIFIEYLMAVFEKWFLDNDIEISHNGKQSYRTTAAESSESKSDANSLEIISQIDKKKEIIGKAIEYINSEINKLDNGYIRNDIIQICKAAYEQFVPTEKKKGIVKVTEFADRIFPKLEHNISKWTLKQFKKFLSNNLSPNTPKGKTPIIGIFFL